jgi:hypothetical protein
VGWVGLLLVGPVTDPLTRSVHKMNHDKMAFCVVLIQSHVFHTMTTQYTSIYVSHSISL